MAFRHGYFLIRIGLVLLAFNLNIAGAQVVVPLTDTSLVIQSISIRGNKTTRENIILRELEFKVGDTLTTSSLDQKIITSRQNLLNTRLFNFVDFTSKTDSNSGVNIELSLDERWYTWPEVIFSSAETNFNTWWRSKDFSRLNYGVNIKQENFRGRNETIKVGFQNGWKRKLLFSYSIPYINKKQTMGMALQANYSRNREINYQSVNNERVFHKEDRFILEQYSGKLKYFYRGSYYNKHEVSLGYQQGNVNDTVVILSNDYLAGNAQRTEYLTAAYHFRRERRNNRYYPLKGYLFTTTLTKSGLGVFDNGPDLLTSEFTLNIHKQLYGRWYAALGTKAKANLLDLPPYSLQQGLGYGNFVRGYEYYVIDGQQYLLFKSNVKYELVKPHTKKLGFMPLKKFDKFHYSVYLNIFADAGYVSDELYQNVNPLSNEWQFGYGVGIDFVTYYDIVIRFEYAFNIRGESDLFIHFRNPI